MSPCNSGKSKTIKYYRDIWRSVLATIFIFIRGCSLNTSLRWFHLLHHFDVRSFEETSFRYILNPTQYMTKARWAFWIQDAVTSSLWHTSRNSSIEQNLLDPTVAWCWNKHYKLWCSIQESEFMPEISLLTVLFCSLN